MRDRNSVLIGRMESLGSRWRRWQYSQRALGTQRSERHRADLDRVLAEQIVALRIADLAATRLAGLQQRFEHFDVGAADGVGAQEPPGCRFQGPSFFEKQHQDRMHGVEIFAQGSLDCIDGLEQVMGFDQPLAQSMNAVGQGVVGARHIDQFLQLAFERLIALAQHLYLTLHQAHGGTGVAQVREPQFGQQGSIALEKIWMTLQIVGDIQVVESVVFDTACLTRCHYSAPYVPFDRRAQAGSISLRR